jgi:hypothetical protein
MWWPSFQVEIRSMTGRHSEVGKVDHLGQVKGSTFPDQVRDRLLSSESILPSFYWIPLRIYPVKSSGGGPQRGI